MASKNNNKTINVSLSNSYDWVFPVIITSAGGTDCWIKYPDFPEYPEYILEKYDEDFIRGRLVNLIYSKYDNLNRVPKPNGIILDDIFNSNSMIKFIGINKKDIFDQFNTNRVNITVSIPFYLNEILKNNDLILDLDKLMIIAILKKLNLV